MSAESELRERRRIIYQRRLRALQEQYGLPHMDRARMYRLTSKLADMTGEGIDDMQLRVLHNLATRGMFD